MSDARRIFYVGCIGEPDYTKLTLGPLQRYAESCGAEFELVTESRYKSPWWVFFECLQRYANAPYGTEAVIADADLLAVGRHNNVFDFTPGPNSVYGQGYVHVPLHKGWSGYQHQLTNMDWPHEPDFGPRINTGMVGMLQSMARRLSPLIEEREGVRCDQAYFNALLSAEEIRLRHYPEDLIGFSGQQSRRLKDGLDMSTLVHHNSDGKLQRLEEMLQLYSKHHE